MKIIDLEFQKFSDLLSRVTGGIMMSHSEFSISDYKIFSGFGAGGYRASFKASARGRKKAKTSGYAKGRIFRNGNSIVSVSSSRAFAVSD